MRRRSANSIALAAALAALGALAPSPALAYEDQFTLGLGGGYAHSIKDGDHAPGVIGELNMSFGLDEAWALRLRAGVARHWERDVINNPYVVDKWQMPVDFELLYIVDIVEFVPYAGGGIGWHSARGDDPDEALGVHVVAGCDWLLSRSFALELDLRATFYADDVPVPGYLTAVLSTVFLYDR